MTRWFRPMLRKRRNNTRDEPSPDKRQEQFLREHEARMRKVDEAVADVKRAANGRQSTEKPAGV